MQKFLKLPLVRTLLLLASVCALVVGCRTLDLILGYPVPPASQLIAQARLRVTEEPVEIAQVPLEPTEELLTIEEPTEEPLTFELPPTPEPPLLPPPTDPQPPTEEPVVQDPPPTRIAGPASVPQPTPTDAGPVATPEPTRCPQTYCVVFRGCQPDSGNTVIEGYVYNNGVPENGVVVRVAKEPGAFPLVDDFKSGNSSINPGQLDPNTPGYYILQIVAGEPREGNWWVFIVDVPNGTKQKSEAKLIHTNDDPFNPANCQRAFVDFVR